VNGAGSLGRPRLHLRRTDSTNARARDLAATGAPHGTLVTAAEQTEGRGRQGRRWSAPAGTSLLSSVILRDPPPLLPLAAGIAVAETAEAAGAARAAVKWPNDVLLEGRKLAGILVEGRPQHGWAVLGIGINVAVDPRELPPEVAATAASLGLEPAAVETVLAELLRRLETWLAAPEERVLEACRARDALLGQPVAWANGKGVGAGIDDAGSLLVRTESGELLTLDAGEVHLGETT